MIDQLERLCRRVSASLDRSEWTARLLGLPPTAGRSGAPGLLLIQIDGLARTQLERALAAGVVPNLARLLRRGGYELTPVYSGMPSSTPAFQAELHHGQPGAVPAYGFVHRKTGRVFEMSEPVAASTIEAGLSGRPLLAGGSSYGNIYAGGADHARFCMSSLGWGDLFAASRWWAVPIVAAMHPELLARGALGVVRELLRAPIGLLGALRRGENPTAELRFAQARVGVCVLLREILAFLVDVDLARGVPVIHVDLLGYDEYAHRRRPSSPAALRSLQPIDDVIGHLVGEARRSRRRAYDVWVFSDHGQEDTESYEARHRRSVASAVCEVLARHGVTACDGGHPSHGEPGRATLAFGERLAQAVIPGLDLRPRYHDTDGATVVAQGPVGHVYLPEGVAASGRAAIDAVAADLVADAEVPLVMAASEPGLVRAWTSRGRYDLPGDAAEVLGADHPYLDRVAEDLVSLCHHPDSGELVISGWRLEGLPVSFPHENGSHAGPGPAETDAFVVAPADTPFDHDPTRAPRAGDLRRAALAVLDAGRPRRLGRRLDRGVDVSQITFRVVTYNVHACVGLDGKLAPERIARVLARLDPDVVALQELDVGRARSGHIDQAAEIASRLEMLLEFHPTIELEDERYGDAVLSRLPMRLVRRGTLPALDRRPRLEPRGAVWVELDVGGRPVQFVTTHLSVHPAESHLQARALMGPQWLGAVDAGTPLVLCGDFNALSSFPTCRAITPRLRDAQVGVEDHRPRGTWGGRYALARIDHVFVDPAVEVRHVQVGRDDLARIASDHQPLVVDLALPSPSAD